MRVIEFLYAHRGAVYDEVKRRVSKWQMSPAWFDDALQDAALQVCVENREVPMDDNWVRWWASLIVPWIQHHARTENKYHSFCDYAHNRSYRPRYRHKYKILASEALKDHEFLCQCTTLQVKALMLAASRPELLVLEMAEILGCSKSSLAVTRMNLKRYWKEWNHNKTVKFHRKRGRKPKPKDTITVPERDARIYRMALDGVAYRDIGAMEGLSAGHIASIVCVCRRLYSGRKVAA